MLMPYRDFSNGARDTRTVMLYGYTFNFTNTKTVKSITLPSNRNVVVLAMNLSGATSYVACGRRPGPKQYDSPEARATVFCPTSAQFHPLAVGLVFVCQWQAMAANVLARVAK
jgi:hypothetical protein